MLKVILCLMTLLLAEGVWALNIKGTIHHLDYPRPGEDLTLVYLSSGDVLKVPVEEKDLHKELEEAFKHHQVLELEYNHDRFIEAVSSFQDNKQPVTTKRIPTNESYNPTILSSQFDASQLFRSLRRGATSWSQCYNRAHIWAYESKYYNDINSMKVFLFFTRKYIRQYNYKWWFHVSPFTYVDEGNGIQEKVLDLAFTRGPTPMKQWTDLFMYNRATCPEVTKYSQYENHQEEEYCYLHKATMFYLQPLDLDNLERSGQIKSNWVDYEVRRAYRNGFNINVKK